ncbi:MAG: ImmA/IrrE family metallo-endopeptidase [Spirochaetales bacterium]|nr:ImmA/IrrE family metallo-endopeptidase [Spirochaetales bacterium]
MHYSDVLKVKKNVSDFRSTNGLSSKEPVDLYALLRKLDILTLFKPLSDSISGIVCRQADKSMFMLINSNKSVGRQHFTIAHELYHLFYDETFDSLLLEKNLKGTEENKADCFATHLIMPEEGILELIPELEMSKNSITPITLLKIESSYKCSRSALLYRLKELKLVDQTFINNHKVNLEYSAIKNGYSPDLYKSGNENKIIGDYIPLVNNLYDNDKISESHYETLLSDIGMGDLVDF